MKKIILNMMALFAVILIAGCEKENFRAFSETQVEIEKSNVTFTAKGGVGTIEVAASALPFTATSDQPWCKASVSGSIITVEAEPNIDKSGRTALITVKSQDRINFVPVTQASVYLHLNNYETIIFLGNGGTGSFSYTCDVPVSVVLEDAWITSSISDNVITLTAQMNPDFLNGRNTKIKIIAGDGLVTIPLEVVQGELITSYEPDPNINTIDNFLNLKNNNGTSSRYKVTYFSSRLATLYANLKTAYPILQEIRIEAPRSSYKLSVILYNLNEATPSSYFWNATNGLVPVNDSKSVATFAFSGNTYSGTTAPYTSNANYTEIRACFASGEGFTIIPDSDNSYWFRSIANPMDYFKVEPASW
jgi:hypothetical protein